MQISSPTSSSSLSLSSPSTRVLWKKSAIARLRRRSFSLAAGNQNSFRVFLVFLWTACFLVLVWIWSGPPSFLGSNSSSSNRNRNRNTLGGPRPLRSSSLRSVHGHGDDHEDDHHKLDSYFGTYANVSKNFDWSDLPISNGVEGNCGADKCFWRSVSDPTTVGYLVASARYHYDRMRKAYDFAVDVLDATCHAKHLYLEPPELVRVEHGFAEHLNGLRQNRHYEYVDKIAPKLDGLRSRSDRIVYDATDPYLVVQKVRVAPDPSLAFGYMARKWDLLVVEDLPRFRTLLAERGTDLKTLEAKLETERRKIECAMDHSPTYWYDLQGLIDPDGNYHHMDVDSQFWVGVGDPTQPVDDDEGVKIVDQKETYDQRHELIGKFNEMIQRLVHPPPEGVDELPAWDDDGTA